MDDHEERTGLRDRIDKVYDAFNDDSTGADTTNGIATIADNQAGTTPSKGKAALPDPVKVDGVPWISFPASRFRNSSKGQNRYTRPGMQLDVEKYIGQFEGFDLSEAEKTEILHTLWNIMCRFVELGFGVDSYSMARDRKEAVTAVKPCEQQGRKAGEPGEDAL